MQTESLQVADTQNVSVNKNTFAGEALGLTGFYEVECYGEDGQLKWSDSIKNLVVTVGRNDLLDKYFSGTSYTATWYMGLVNSTSFTAYAAGDTLASHSGWLEFIGYTGTDRTAVSWNAASAGSKATTGASFNLNTDGAILGALLCTTQVKGTASNGGAGVLYSAGSFTGGARAVLSGDTITVTYTATTS